MCSCIMMPFLLDMLPRIEHETPPTDTKHRERLGQISNIIRFVVTLSLSLSLSLTHTHTYIRTYTHAQNRSHRSLEAGWVLGIALEVSFEGVWQARERSQRQRGVASGGIWYYRLVVFLSLFRNTTTMASCYLPDGW